MWKNERAEEIGERGSAVRHRQVHLGGQNSARAVHPGGEIEIPDEAVHQQHRAAQSVVYSYV